MKIYTKEGDKGQTSLIGGNRVAKNDPRLEAYGSMDELISYIGLLKELYDNNHYYTLLTGIQERLMVASALLACGSRDVESGLPSLNESDIKLLESEIDLMEDKLPALKSFILPGGNQIVAICHVCRTVCRRVERICVGLDVEIANTSIIISYTNRLSDFLFVLSRFISMETGAKEIPWVPEL